MLRTTLLTALLALPPLLFAQNVQLVPSSPVPVQIAIALIDIREIDGARQSFAADVFIRLRWKDQRLAHQGMRSLPLSAAWNPPVQIGNRIAVQTSLPESMEIDDEGNVLYRQRYIGTFSCRMNLHDFPFDRQTIPIRLGVPGMLPQQIKFLDDPESIIASNLSMTDWGVTAWRVREQSYQAIPGSRAIAGYVFEFDCKRYFYYFLVQIVFPLTLILGMSWIVFWIDRALDGPRISISITAMLTTVAYRLMIANFLPRLPYLTRLDYFVFGSTLLVFGALVVVVAIARLRSVKKENSAVWLDVHSRWFFPALFVLLVCGSFLF